MANNPYKNKVIYNGQTLIDLTGDTVAPETLLSGYTAHDASGAPIVGTATGGGIIIEDTTDSHGGTIRRITSANVIRLGTKSITANGTYTPSSDSLDGYSSVTVNVSGSMQSKSVTPTESVQTVTPDAGYDGLSSVEVGAIDSEYIGSDVPERGSSDLTVSGATVTAPAGYYGAGASKSVASGTAGTPTATKGSVSNHTVSVTPSVTNTTGYITGGTKTGTAVTVSASELVSGSQNITANNTYDVTNLASVVVNVSGGGGKNVQAYLGRSARTANSYGATDVTLTVAKTGTYNVSWCAWRSSSSGTMGTNLHRNSTAGTNQQTFTNTYGQCITLTNQSYTQGDVLTLYATSGSNSRTINVANLIIEEQ